MPLDQERLKASIVSKMEAEGAVATGEYSWVNKLATVISAAVVEEITTNAQVAVTSGSSQGNWPVT
ncbi:hypothetical protein [Photobacterium sp. R1]